MALPTQCPSCHAQLQVKSLTCNGCGTEIKGSYDLPFISLLTADEQAFVLRFIKSSGSLKEMSNQMQLSYPSVRNLLNDIIKKLEKYE